ncbi:MAG: type II CRISPR RNA-guided endonuclease Cas9 [Rikenellaceae bacterium]|nr:type II CRISPR RNA-guided endonuclease Cas9 [Rikenellaceae bacterium]
MKRVLGLDLGSTSIGWAIIEENSEEVVSESTPLGKDKIIAIGSRIIPLSVDESTQFSKGQALTKNSDRTAKRTQRKGFDRYQLRRALLLEELKRLGMLDGGTLRCSTLELWALRAKAATAPLSLPELGRVLCHINQKRGYRTAKSDFSDKKLGAHVQQVVSRYRELHEQNKTVGQFLYDGLRADPSFRCKERVYPRDAYMEEFDAIMACQKRYYPEILTEKAIAHIRDYIIFHQRPLKSCKHLVGRCELERHDVQVEGVEGRIRNQGPRVAPRSSPLFQVCKIWESINNLAINNKVNDTLAITLEQKQAIFNYMNTNERLKATTLKTLLGIKSKEWQFTNSIGSGLQGNTTYCAIANALGTYPGREELLRFDLQIADGDLVNAETGELSKVVAPSFEQQPLYRLWHALYSISDIVELRKVLKDNFSITDEAVVDALIQLDFVKAGYGNKSSRAMRKILPYLMEGMCYYDAKLAAGYDDTPLTKAQNEERELAEKLLPIQKGELRQPVVEKILNQLVNLVNALMAEHGRFDEIRVELARALKQSREERESDTKRMNNNQRENDTIAKRIKEEYHLTPTRSRIQKVKMWEETEHICIYCGATVNVAEFLLGSGVEVEHIIPRSVLFDDSFSNKACACRKCNQEKGNKTAYDFMSSQSEGALQAYIERVNDLEERKKISKAKRNKLLMKGENLPSDFIERQLRESQYIAKKAKEMLQSVCRNVYSTSGSITDFIRHIWGWDEVLHTLNFERYRAAGLTELVEREVNGQKVEVERIKGWSKRMDHRHHAVDALTIACTKQGYIQRINNLNSLKETSFCSFANEQQKPQTRQRLTRLEHYIQQQPHFTTAEVADAVAGIAVSFKSGKRAASLGKRYIYKGRKRVCVQQGIIIPRGALSEESVYGRITDSETRKKEYVIKYKVGNIALKDVESVVDKGIREILRNRLEQFGGNPDKAFAEPVLDHQGREIRSVRCRTGLNSVVPLRRNEQGDEIAFVKPGNNHHVAIYEDEKGKWQEHIATFWHAVERKKYDIPVIITRPDEAWDRVSDRMPQSFIDLLPGSATWRFKFSMQQNEMFILGMEEELYREAMRNKDYAMLSKYLYRVQKLAHNDYVFRHHLETTVDDKYNGVKNQALSINMKKLIRVQSLNALQIQNPHKVHIGVTGNITEL